MKAKRRGGEGKGIDINIKIKKVQGQQAEEVVRGRSRVQSLR